MCCRLTCFEHTVLHNSLLLIILMISFLNFDFHLFIKRCYCYFINRIICVIFYSLFCYLHAVGAFKNSQVCIIYDNSRAISSYISGADCFSCFLVSYIKSKLRIRVCIYSIIVCYNEFIFLNSDLTICMDISCLGICFEINMIKP